LKNPISPLKITLFRDCAPADSRDKLSHILFCSIPGGRESEFIKFIFIHKGRFRMFFWASSVHYHPNRRSNTNNIEVMAK